MMQGAMFSFFKRDSQTYHRLSDDEKFSEDSAFLSGQAVTREPARRIWPYVLPWMISSAIFAFMSVYFYLSSLEPAYGSFERGWSTDFKPAREYIEKHDTMFTGGPVFATNGSYYVPHPDPVNYIGEPGPEIDRAWEELTWGRYFLISKAEAEDALRRDYPNDDIEEFWSPIRGGYDVGVDMFHTLHCLNRLRMALNPEYYSHEASGDHANLAVHQGHCIEQIRQYVMCSGDMTVIPTRYNKGRRRSYVESDVTHTCRNFDLLREFVKERFNGSLAVQPVCPHGFYEDKEHGSRSCVVPKEK